MLVLLQGLIPKKPDEEDGNEEETEEEDDTRSSEEGDDGVEGTENNSYLQPDNLLSVTIRLVRHLLPNEYHMFSGRVKYIYNACISFHWCGD